MIYVSIILSIITILLLLFFLIRFKNLFSTDSLIEDTKTKVNRILTDLNRNTQTDIDLIQENSRKLKEYLAQVDKKILETEKKMELFQEASQRLRDMIAEADKINRLSNQKSSLYNDFNKIQKTNQTNNINNMTNRNINAYKTNVDPNARFEIKKSDQQDLFDNNLNDENSQNGYIINDEIKVTNDGAAYKEVPLFTTKILDEKPEKIEKYEKTLPQKVEELYNQNMTVEQIATKLSCSVTEVQLIIEML